MTANLIPLRICNDQQYRCALAQRELVAAPLRDPNGFKPGALPIADRRAMERFLVKLDLRIAEYEDERRRAQVFGVPR